MHVVCYSFLFVVSIVSVRFYSILYFDVVFFSSFRSFFYIYFFSVHRSKCYTWLSFFRSRYHFIASQARGSCESNFMCVYIHLYSVDVLLGDTNVTGLWHPIETMKKKLSRTKNQPPIQTNTHTHTNSYTCIYICIHMYIQINVWNLLKGWTSSKEQTQRDERRWK